MSISKEHFFSDELYHGQFTIESQTVHFADIKKSVGKEEAVKAQIQTLFEIYLKSMRSLRPVTRHGKNKW